MRSFFHGLNQWSPSDILLQNFSGFSMDCLYNLRYCSSVWITACFLNSGLGLKIRFSFSMLSMFTVLIEGMGEWVGSLGLKNDQ